MKAMLALVLGLFFSLGFAVLAQDQQVEAHKEDAVDRAESPETPELEGNKEGETMPLDQLSPHAKLEKRVFGRSDEANYQGKVVVIKVGENDLVNKQAFKFWRRVIKRVNEEEARALVFDIDTPGGLAFDTAELIMVDMQKIKVPSYAYQP